MDEESTYLEAYPKANLVNRCIAKSLDLLLVWALSKLLPPVGFFAGLAYLLIADGFNEGRSPGKWLIGLRVLQWEGARPCTFRESVLRNSTLALGYLAMQIPILGWLVAGAVAGLEALLMVGNERGLRLGDDIARTQVADSVRLGEHAT